MELRSYIIDIDGLYYKSINSMLAVRHIYKGLMSLIFNQHEI